MGLFDKQKEKMKQDKGANRSIESIWKEAYRANPRAYEKQDGTLLVGFAFTEDTDSIFPTNPEEKWAVDGKVISEWIISIVSLTKDSVIGQMEYHEAIRRLRPYVLADTGDYVLIRGMSHDELDGLL